MTAAEATEACAVLELRCERQVAADSIAAALTRHLEGRRLALSVAAEREEIARAREHYGLLVARTRCADCESMYDGGCCDAHNLNAEYL